MNFSDEPLLCYYADIHHSNFPIDVRGQLWVIDFQQSGVLPASFMNFALRAHPRQSLPIRIAKTIPLEKSPNLAAMGRATYVLKVVHNTFRMSSFVTAFLLVYTVHCLLCLYTDIPPASNADVDHRA